LTIGLNEKPSEVSFKGYPCRHFGEKVEGLTPQLNIDLKEFWFHLRDKAVQLLPPKVSCGG
tara:strand:- start:2467 stop:2649 length:183 start_codon:yes stop_codon:yes gene_type:complete